eukprot:COSAG04_NODE_2891_length_3414_cov_4.032579_2_plen_229_part_00
MREAVADGVAEAQLAAAKLQAAARGHAARRDLDEHKTVRAEIAAIEQRGSLLAAEPEPEPAPAAARAASPGRATALQRARERRQAKHGRKPAPAAATAAAVDGGGGEERRRVSSSSRGKKKSRRPKELHYASSLDTPSERVSVEAFASLVRAGTVAPESVVVWTKGMTTWRLPSEALDVLPELAAVLGGEAPTASAALATPVRSLTFFAVDPSCPILVHTAWLRTPSD